MSLFKYSCASVLKFYILKCTVIFFTISLTSAIPPTTTATPYNNNDDTEYHRNRYGSGRRSCDTEQIEYRLTKLEVQFGEKAAYLISEMREGNRRLHELELQSSEVHSVIEGFRNELSRLTESGQSLGYRVPANYQDDKLESKIAHLIRGVQLVTVSLRGLNSDIGLIKSNISTISNTTSTLLQQHHDLVTKQFLSNSLTDINHHQIYQAIPPNIFREPSTSISNISQHPKSCTDVQENGNNESGIYLIQPQPTQPPFMVLCDMDTRGGGWTYIHNRYDGSQDFYLNWHDYKTGFGNIGGEFWLGLEHIYQLTGHEVNELLVELEAANGEEVYAYYAAFSVGAANEGYALKVLGGYSGDAGDSLIYHAGSRFSTKDLDHDSWAEGNCAQAHSGAWWYRSCDTSNLNGKYLSGELPQEFLYQGIYWAEFKGAQYSLSKARMMIRPRSRGSPPIFPGGLSGSKRN